MAVRQTRSVEQRTPSTSGQGEGTASAHKTQPAAKASGLRELPCLEASAAVQMAIDQSLLKDALFVTARRYVWSPPALSLGRFQKVPRLQEEHGAAIGDSPGDAIASDRLPFEVVRRPSGGRAVLHGAEFEWSFAVVFPAGRQAVGSVDDAYDLVSGAMGEALCQRGVSPEGRGEIPYRRSGLCFATSLRHDLHVGEQKVVAVAQVRKAGATLVHGSVLERRPPAHLVTAVESLLGEPWQGDGLAPSAATDDLTPPVDADALWTTFMAALRSRLAGLRLHERELRPDGSAKMRVSPSNEVGA